MDTRKLPSSFNSTRSVVGSILLLAAVFSLAGAALFQALGLVSDDLGPLPFVSAVLFLKLGFFSFWPVIAEKGRQASASLQEFKDDSSRLIFRPRESDPVTTPSRKKRPHSLSLWDQNDPRLDLALFYNNVPSFVLNHEQRFLDWNPAFELVFGGCRAVRRGAHVSNWFDLLDNYRRVSKRAEKLYGEGILPLADRERVVFVSEEFGRMVFTKLMTPVIDRSTARVIGWNVVLNINSVTRRNEFFERLYARIALETRRLRHAAAWRGLFESYRSMQELIALHVHSIGDASRVLDIGAGVGMTTSALATQGRRVAAVDHNVHMLRQLRDATDAVAHRVRIVKQNPDDLSSLPSGRYEAAVMLNTLPRLEDPLACLQRVFAALRPGGLLSISSLTCGTDVDSLFNSLRSDLERQSLYEKLKHQFNHVLEHERELAVAVPYRPVTRADLRALLIEAGFVLDEEREGLLDGHAIFMTARKPS